MEWFKHKTYSGKRVPYRLSKAIINRDKNTCQYCGRVADETHDSGLAIKVLEHQLFMGDTFYIPFEIDHTKPKHTGGKTHYKNLKLLCRRCNRSKSGRFDEVV